MVSELTQASARLGSGDVVVHRPPTQRSGRPHPCGELGSGAAPPESMREVPGIRPVIRHWAFEPCSPSARVPVRMRRAGSRGLTWPLPSSLAAVIGLAYGMPAASVRLRSRTPWPFLSSATPLTATFARMSVKRRPSKSLSRSSGAGIRLRLKHAVPRGTESIHTIAAWPRYQGLSVFN
jgi:hypothetical protein